MTTKSHEYKDKFHWNDLLHEQFVKESDRAAVILTAALLDNGLEQLLRTSFVPLASSADDLFEGSNAALATFSARINISYRMGLISRRFCRDLHLIRAIRNQFAHNVAGCTFEDGGVRSRILELAKSSRIIERNPKMREEGYEKGPRGDFLMCASWMLFALNAAVERSTALTEAKDEFGYSESATEKAD